MISGLAVELYLDSLELLRNGFLESVDTASPLAATTITDLEWLHNIQELVGGHLLIQIHN